MDRQVIRELVEDYWRTLIPATQAGGAAQFMQVSQEFETRINATAAALDPVEGAAFLQAVDAERQSIASEYEANPAAVKRRLGVPLGVDAPQVAAAAVGADLAGVAVRTAVRATVWEGIWAIFRAFR
jgi:hypothetical protein